MRALSALLLFTPALVMPAQVQVEMPRAGGAGQAATFASQYKTILPHVVFGGGWHNKFIFVNYTGSTALGSVVFLRERRQRNASPDQAVRHGQPTWMSTFRAGARK